MMGFAFTLAYSFSISTSSSHSFSHVKQRGAGLRSGRLYIDIRQQGGSAHYMTMPWVPRAASGLSLLRSNSSSRTASLFALLVLGTLATTLSHAFLISNSQPASSSIARLRASALGPSTPFCLPSSLRAVPEGLLDDDGEPQYDAPARAKIEELIKNNKIVLFMKGTRLFPSCGFSNTAIRILDQLNVEYETVDVLADERIRGEIKRYSAWPTIPQLYLQGDFIGGSDIILEMYQTGELQEMIEIAAAS